MVLSLVGVATEKSVVAEPVMTAVSGVTTSLDDAQVVLTAQRAAVVRGQLARDVQALAAAHRSATLKHGVALARAAAARPVVPKTAAPAVTPVVRTPVVARKAVVSRTTAETAAQRGARVLASLGYAWQRTGYRIEFLPDKHGFLGLTVPEQKLIQVYVRSSESDLVLAHSIAHEIGHALDFTRGSAATHALYLTIRGLSTQRAWFGCSGCTDYETPAGDWAEVFARWLAGPGDFRSRIGGAPSAAQLSQLGALFRA